MQTTNSTPNNANNSQNENQVLTLALPIFELITQIRTQELVPSNQVRATINAQLKQFEQRAVELKYRESQIKFAVFALVSFIDESVLTAQFDFKTEWEKNPLQLELFNEQVAGVTFYEHIDELLKRPEDIDILEIYYICLIFGFRGRYKKYSEDKLTTIIQSIEVVLKKSNRLYPGQLSPHWKSNDQPQILNKVTIPLWLKIGSGIALFTIILLYIVLKIFLNSALYSAKEQLLQ